MWGVGCGMKGVGRGVWGVGSSHPAIPLATIVLEDERVLRVSVPILGLRDCYFAFSFT